MKLEEFLDKLEAMAEAAASPNATGARLGLMAACDPETILRLVAVVRTGAAFEGRRQASILCDPPEAHHFAHALASLQRHADEVSHD